MMKDNWKQIGVVVVLTSLLAASVIPLVMAEEIECTVTAGYYSVTLDRTFVNYGDMGENTAKVDPDGSITATNNGGIDEDLYIYGEPATGPYQTSPSPFTPIWALGSTPAPNTYIHTFNTGSGEVYLTTSNQPLANNISADASQGFTLKLYTPTEISVPGAYDFSVYVVATAP